MTTCVRLYVDAENIKLEEDDFMFLKWKYNVEDAVVYTSCSKEKWESMSFPFPIHIIHIDTISKKNSIDMHICADVVESIFHQEIRTYVIATHDRDFIPLYTKLKSHSKQVIVVGRQMLSDRIRAIVDNTCLLDNIDVNFRILIKAFHSSGWKTVLTLSEMKKNIKRLNLRKQMGMTVFKNMIQMIETDWSGVFLIRKEAKTFFISCLIS